jgi:hypothetical protein
MTVDEQITIYLRDGFCPARTDHLPKKVQDILDEIGLVPGIKECFANCQRFAIDVDRYQLPLDVEYREGYVISIIPIEHAWLMVDGETVDLTLDPDREHEHLRSYAVPVDEIRTNMLKTRSYCAVRPRELVKLSPFYKDMKRLAELNGMEYP